MRTGQRQPLETHGCWGQGLSRASNLMDGRQGASLAGQMTAGRGVAGGATVGLAIQAQGPAPPRPPLPGHQQGPRGKSGTNCAAFIPSASRAAGCSPRATQDSTKISLHSK